MEEIGEFLVDRSHPLSISQYPLLVPIGRMIPTHSSMSSLAHEHVLKLWCRILGPMGGGERQHHQIRFARKESFRIAHILETVVEYQIRIVIELIVGPMAHFVPIHVQRVVVVTGIANQRRPIGPSWRYVTAVVFVQIFPKESCSAWTNKNDQSFRMHPCLQKWTYLFYTLNWRDTLQKYAFRVSLAMLANYNSRHLSALLDGNELEYSTREYVPTYVSIVVVRVQSREH